jgi:hypothetical protein
VFSGEGVWEDSDRSDQIRGPGSDLVHYEPVSAQGRPIWIDGPDPIRRRGFSLSNLHRRQQINGHGRIFSTGGHPRRCSLSHGGAHDRRTHIPALPTPFSDSAQQHNAECIEMIGMGLLPAMATWRSRATARGGRTARSQLRCEIPRPQRSPDHHPRRDYLRRTLVLLPGALCPRSNRVSAYVSKRR